jgi:hypothetical protein
LERRFATAPFRSATKALLIDMDFEPWLSPKFISGRQLLVVFQKSQEYFEIILLIVQNFFRAKISFASVLSLQSILEKSLAENHVPKSI